MQAAKSKYFAYAIHDKVMIIASGEHGEVVARMDSADDGDMFKVRYRNALGIATEQWWNDSAITLYLIN